MFSNESSQLPPSSSLGIHVTEENFMAEIVEASRNTPVIVDFWAEWCGPCKQLTPLLEENIKPTAGRIKFTLVNVEENPSLVAQLEQLGLPLHSIPLVVAFWKGQVIDLFQGIKPASFIKKFIETLLKESGQSLPVAELLTTAHTALKSGQASEATALFSEALENEPENPQAWAGMIRALIALEDLENAQEALGQIPEKLLQNADIIAAQNALTLTLEGLQAAASLAQYRQEALEHPHDFEKQLKLSQALNGIGEKEEAANILLTLIKHDHNAHDGAAKMQLLRLFEAWGMTDPTTLKMRRALSAILFS